VKPWQRACLWAFILGVILAFSGCFHREAEALAAPSVDPADPIGSVGLWAAWLGSLGVVAAVVLAALQQFKLAITAITIGLGGIIAGVVLGWLATHIGLVVGGLSIGTIAWLLWRNRYKAEKLTGVDMNRDGVIGRPDEEHG
jgi:hypothetical protein